MPIVDTSNAEHYLWGDSCDGWHPVKQDDLSVITDRVPAGECEQRHYHVKARQFFYILSGEAVMEVSEERFVLRSHQGIEILLGVAHQFRSESDSDVLFLVISAPKAHGDRLVLPSVEC